MAAYVITQRLKAPKNPEEIAKYPALAKPVIERFGGRFIIASDNVRQIEGNGPCPVRTSVIEFPSVEHAMGWYNSEEYQAAAKIRHANTESHMIVVSNDAPVLPR